MNVYVSIAMMTFSLELPTNLARRAVKETLIVSLLINVLALQ